jgi:hypothetical protein
MPFVFHCAGCSESPRLRSTRRTLIQELWPVLASHSHPSPHTDALEHTSNKKTSCISFRTYSVIHYVLWQSSGLLNGSGTGCLH